MADLETQLVESTKARHRLIATDGVFSMDGYVAPLDRIVELAERHDALVMVDDSHAVGFMGPTGAGTPELFGVQDRIDIVTGTLGKALGGASGGYTAARAEIVEMLRQRSRPYLFSNSLALPSRQRRSRRSICWNPQASCWLAYVTTRPTSAAGCPCLDSKSLSRTTRSCRS